MARFFDVPFARSGDRAVTPDDLQLDGSMSYTEGFGFDYERPAIDPNTGQPDPLYKPIPRNGTNGLFFDLTDAVGLLQKQGFADWTSEAGTYAVNSWVRNSGKTWRSLVPTAGVPGVSLDWVDTSLVVSVPLSKIYFMGQN